MLTAMGIAVSCRDNRAKHRDAGVLQPGGFALYQQDPLANPVALAALTSALQSGQSAVTDEPTLWAMAHCDCTPRHSGVYLSQLSLQRGALPQVLVPTVREQIANDPKLKALNNLPPALQGIADALSQFFVNDEKLAGMVRDGVSEKLARSLSVPSLATQHSFRFDGFAPPFFSPGAASSVHPHAFDAGAQGTKWAFIFGSSNMWNGGPPLAFASHALQLLGVAQTLSEWQYLFGMEKASTDQRIYGGLSIDPRSGVGSPLGPFDPRANPGATPRIISGSYRITYPTDGRSLDMAINVREQWTRDGSEVALQEQAKIWVAAGQAFHRLRPANRQRLAHAFLPPTGMFPPETHQLPLVFLSGLGEMLNGPFIDQEALRIFGSARIPGASAGNQASADLLSVVRLARALGIWVKETENTSDAQLSPEVQRQLGEAHVKLTSALQLAVQTVLADFVRHNVPNRSLYGYSLVQSPTDERMPSMAVAAETLATLIEIEQVLLPSELLRNRLASIYHWFAAQYLAAGRNAQGATPIDTAAVLWTLQAAHRFSLYQTGIPSTPWARAVADAVGKVVAGWDQQGGGS